MSSVKYLKGLKKYQLVILRNYGFVDDSRICQILNISKSQLKKEVEILGLKPLKHEGFDKKSYITLIRNNWDLLNKKQLLILLNISEEKFDFILKNEDFLYVKLGEKPECSDVVYESLDENDLNNCKEISKIISAYPDKKQYFDFEYSSKISESKYKKIIIHPYDLTTSGNFDDIELSDALLDSYKKCGIKAIWFSALLQELSEYPFSNKVINFVQNRNKLQSLIDKCKKHDIGVYLYFNEPRFLNDDLAKENNERIGHKHNGENAICLSLKENQDYLYNSFLDLFRNLNNLMGVITITMSENLTHCHSKGFCNCERCKDEKPEYFAALVNNLIQKAANDSHKNIEVIANVWGWSSFMNWNDENLINGIKMLDKKISIMAVSEYGLSIEHAKEKLTLVDYSISNIGPSEITKKIFKLAKEEGHKIYAKIQINNSWECSSVPFFPNYISLYEHISNLKEIGVEECMGSWTLGGYPSKSISLVNEVFNNNNFDINNWLRINFVDDERFVEAINELKKGFEKYPFSVDNLYFGPKTLGPANLWDLENKLNSSMVCFSRNDYQKWINPFEVENYLLDYEELFAHFSKALNLLGNFNSKEIEELKDFVEITYLCFKEDYLKTKHLFLTKNGKKDFAKSLISEEYENTEQFYNLFVKYSEVGFESSNHYFYTERNFIEKLLNLKDNN